MEAPSDGAKGNHYVVCKKITDLIGNTPLVQVLAPEAAQGDNRGGNLARYRWESGHRRGRRGYRRHDPRHRRGIRARRVASRPSSAEKTIVAILPDTGERYLSTWPFEEGGEANL
ncbi:hypothetical protein SPIRO4BDMA_50036 [uncultured spirochete]|uniref:Cysteine synthase n=1 Tax=uncultured spirochete TaxID=156406 RepID=A0A3P3XQE5_9SPIR|nr:hypothetical protein SPIRO4BDMA_50036 [uncultured spirochete]